MKKLQIMAKPMAIFQIATPVQNSTQTMQIETTTTSSATSAGTQSNESKTKGRPAWKPGKK